MLHVSTRFVRPYLCLQSPSGTTNRRYEGARIAWVVGEVRDRHVKVDRSEGAKAFMHSFICSMLKPSTFETGSDGAAVIRPKIFKCAKDDECTLAGQRRAKLQDLFLREVRFSLEASRPVSSFQEVMMVKIEWTVPGAGLLGLPEVQRRRGGQ